MFRQRWKFARQSSFHEFNKWKSIELLQLDRDANAQDIVKRVEELAGDNAPGHLVFGDRCGNPVVEPEDAEMAGVVPVIAGVDDDDVNANDNDKDSATTIQEQEEANEEINFPKIPASSTGQ